MALLHITMVRKVGGGGVVGGWWREQNTVQIVRVIAREQAHMQARAGEKNGARKSKPALELLIFQFHPSRGVMSAFHTYWITIQ